MAWAAARARLLSRHVPPARSPLKAIKGDRLRTGELSEEWPAFRWCVGNRELSGWVPDRYLSRLVGEAATALRDYDTTELAAEAGEIVTVIEADEESGWLWCSGTSGRGWVPLSSVEPFA